MGKPTGFMEYAREDAPASSPKARIQNYNEIHEELSETERKQQAARCMDCGVPFCQYGKMISGMASGCPLNNLIPEWNDLLYTGNMVQAFNRLTKTNCFPEFTGRVCPALCNALSCACLRRIWRQIAAFICILNDGQLVCLCCRLWSIWSVSCLLVK